MLLWKEEALRQHPQETLKQQLKAHKDERAPEGLNNVDDKQPQSLSVDPTAWQPILEAQRPGRPDILAKMLGLYLRDSRELVDTILAALAKRDSEALLESAHGLKSCSAMVGASRLVELCDQLEDLRSAQSLEEASTLIPAVRQEFDRVCDIFSAELARRTL